MEKTLCIYHKDCIDGYAAAWVVGHAIGFENVEFHAASHGTPLPSMAGRIVYMVDFLPSSPGDVEIDTLKEMGQAKRIVVLDHHESAYANWKDVPLLDNWTYRYEPELSGVGVTWRWFFGKQPMPMALQLIQDRDLWKFELKLSREFHAVAVSEGLLLKTPSEDSWLTRMIDSGVSDERWYVRNDLIRLEGAAIIRDQKNHIQTLLKRARIVLFMGYEVPVCNIPYELRSEAGFWLSLKYPFSITYDDVWSEGIRKYSVRSNKKTGIDVMKVTEPWGGGGHKHASGFALSIDEPFPFTYLYGQQLKLDFETS